jgi:large subunit ribosomal protein L30
MLGIRASGWGEIGGASMCVTRITVQQIRSPIRRDHSKPATLIGLKLNKIGRTAELPDTPETRGMIAKVAHLVRIIGQETELDCFIRAVRAEYQELIATRIRRGDILWAQFEAAVEACRADPTGDDRQITEKVNEMAVANHSRPSAPRGTPATAAPASRWAELRLREKHATYVRAGSEELDDGGCLMVIEGVASADHFVVYKENGIQAAVPVVERPDGGMLPICSLSTRSCVTSN